MKFWNWKLAIAAIVCLQGVLLADGECDDCAVGETFVTEDITEDCVEPCIEVYGDDCQEEYWCREIAYEPMYYTTQKCIEKQIPVKKLCCKMVPKKYKVQRVRYVPEYYTEMVTKNEMEYFYQDDWKVTTQMVSERQCEWVPKFVWKKVTCVVDDDTQQDD